jgi:hypothetical protein
VVLAPQGADLTHPAFSNLFIELLAVPEHNGIICTRRPRAQEPRLYMGHVLAGQWKTGSRVEFETDRERFIGRGRQPKFPAAMMTDKPLSGSVGAVLDPIVSLRVKLRIPSGGTARISFTTVVAENEGSVRALIEKLPRSAGHGARLCAGQHPQRNRAAASRHHTRGRESFPALWPRGSSTAIPDCGRRTRWRATSAPSRISGNSAFPEIFRSSS